MPECEKVAEENAKKSGGSFKKVATMEEAFKDADIVYPKSWASFAVMEERTKLVEEKKFDELDALEKKCLENNAKFKNWACTEDMMKLTKDGKALYLHMSRQRPYSRIVLATEEYPMTIGVKVSALDMKILGEIRHLKGGRRSTGAS